MTGGKAEGQEGGRTEGRQGGTLVGGSTFVLRSRGDVYEP